MAKVELKAPVVAEISEAIKDAQSVVLVDYRGLTVEQDTALRKQLREAGINYKVYKNTMMNFAFKGTDFEALAPFLEGPSAIAIPTQMLQHLPENLQNSQRLQANLKSKQVSWKALYMTHRGWLQFPSFLPEKNCSPSCLEAFSHLSPILHVS